jgi:hypothetical protein
MSTKARSGNSREGRGGGGKMQHSSHQDVFRLVKAELKQNGMEVPKDQGAREALVNGTRAYILAVAKDAVSRGEKSCFPEKLGDFIVDLIFFFFLCCRKSWRQMTRSTRSRWRTPRPRLTFSASREWNRSWVLEKRTRRKKERRIARAAEAAEEEEAENEEEEATRRRGPSEDAAVSRTIRKRTTRTRTARAAAACRQASADARVPRLDGARAAVVVVEEAAAAKVAGEDPTLAKQIKTIMS